MPSSSIPARRAREDDDNAQEPQDRGLRRRRLLSVQGGVDDENMEVDEERPSGNGPLRHSGWVQRTLGSLSTRRRFPSDNFVPEPSISSRHTANDTTPSHDTSTTIPSPDPLAAERQEAVSLIERVLGPRPAPPHHPSIDPSSLSGTYRSRPSRFSRPENVSGGRPTSTLGTLLSEVLGATRGEPGAGAPGTPGGAPLSGTSVIVQGALVARTAASQGTDSTQTPTDGSAPERGPSSGTPNTGTESNASTDSEIPHVATLAEQGEMLGRILRIAAAATAASVVNQAPFNPTMASTAFAAPPQGSPQNLAPTSEPPQNRSGTSESNFGRELLNRLMASRQATRRSSVPQERDTQSDSETVSNISRLMRDALRASLPQRGSSPPPHENRSASANNANNETISSVLSTLESARQNQPLTDGEPGSFDRFLRELLDDLNAAIHRMNGSDVESEAAGDVRSRRDGDVVLGQLSFFRLHRFERPSDSSLIPCVMVGVRSLRSDERLMGGDHAIPRDGEGNQPDVSRFVLFVSGGRYHEQHPLLVSRPRDAGRDLMFMMELLGTIAAMSNKRPTTTAADIERSGLLKVKAKEIANLHREGRVTENTLDKCLVCLDEWQEDDDCRVLSCKHVFHASCVDQWLENNSNSCPLCTYIQVELTDRPDRSRFDIICISAVITLTGAHLA